MENLKQLVRVEAVEDNESEVQLVVDAVVMVVRDKSEQERLERLASHLRSVIKRGPNMGIDG